MENGDVAEPSVKKVKKKKKDKQGNVTVACVEDAKQKAVKMEVEEEEEAAVRRWGMLWGRSVTLEYSACKKNF